MKKIFLIVLTLVIFSLSSHHQVKAISTAPFSPFSIEGNPDEDYQFDEFFPLLRFINPPDFTIFENKDRNRHYEDLKICDGPDSDRRDYFCNNQGDGCDGGPVDLCKSDTGQSARTVISGGGSCRYFGGRNNNDPDLYLEGKCEYKKNPKISGNVKGTDFTSSGALSFPKIQSEQAAYDYEGGENSITWGSLQLSLTQDQKYIKKLMVLVRAKQTKITKESTKHWPLGWVDWGYETKNGKKLIEIYDEIPNNILLATEKIVAANDAFYLSGGDISKLPDTTRETNIIVNSLSQVGYHTNRPEWIVDLEQSPLYSPSYRQGFIRPSICVWDKCCLTTLCPLPEELLIGNKRGLYYDTSISQTYGAAIDDLFITYQMAEGISIYKDLLQKNPLARYLLTATPAAIPPKVNEELKVVTKGTCIEYVPWDRWLNFGLHMDYLDEGQAMGPNNTCPDLRFGAETVVKETAGATNLTGLKYLMSLLWGGRSVDDVEPTTYHLLSFPEAMGQAIASIQGPVYDTRDTLSELESIKEYNSNMSNIVDNEADHLFSGKKSGPNNSKRFTSLYSCADDMYANQKLVNIEAYATGARPDCYGESEVPAGKCDGKLFAKLIEGSKYQETSPKGTEYFTTNIKSRLTPELMKTYAAAEKETGVPCEVLAGIHFVEADNNPDGSLVSGRKIGTPEPDAGGKVFKSLLETAKYAGDHLKGKIGGNLSSVESVITALSRYNGGGNSNCQAGYPYPIPYGGCPRAYEGEDDPYPTSFLDNKHNSMYLLYCADYTACAPQIFERPGSFTVALNVYNSITKTGYNDSDLPKDAPKDQTPPPSNNNPATNTAFFPKSCGPGSLSTALGCLPYTKDSFVSTILTFLVGIAGAIALVVMLISTIQLMTSAGDTKKIQSARDLFTSAIAGLLFLIFAVSLLRLIAGDIIKLPGF